MVMPNPGELVLDEKSKKYAPKPKAGPSNKP